MTLPQRAVDEMGRPKAPLALLLGFALAACSPQAPPAPLPPLPPPDASPTRETIRIGVVDNPQALEAFLQAEAARTRSSPPRAVVARTVDGGPTHPRVTLVLMADPGWCGSGGCTLFILVPAGDGLAELSSATLVHPPVLVLDTRTNGMPDISVRVRSDSYPGDGAKFVALPFDGRTYASNPTMPPAYLLPRLPDGEIAISEDEVAIAFGR